MTQGGSESWVYQGRQEHGWFGHGTAPPRAPGPGHAGTVQGGIDAAIHGAVAALPAGRRQGFERILAQGGMAALHGAMPAWAEARSAGFRERFFGPVLGDQGAGALRQAARLAVAAATPQAQREAAGALADAVADIGLGRLPHVLAVAAQRAEAMEDGGDGADGSSGAAPPPPYVAAKPFDYRSGPAIGDGECVTLVKRAAVMPVTREWKQGEQVMGNTALPIGTIIATFDRNGRYNGHAAIYMGQDSDGVHVFEQWAARRMPDGTIRPAQPPHARTLPWNSPHRSSIDVGSSYHVVR